MGGVSYMNKWYPTAPCSCFHTSPCMHARHTSCLNLSTLGIHCEGKGPGASTPLCPDTMTLLLWGRTDTEHLPLKPHPHPHRTHKHISEQVMLECTCFPRMSYMYSVAFLDFAPNCPFCKWKHTSCVRSHISLSSQHLTQHAALTHWTLKKQVLFNIPCALCLD